MKTQKVRKVVSLAPVLVALALQLAMGNNPAVAVTAGGSESPLAQNREVPVIPDKTEQKILEHMQGTQLQRLQGWPGMIFYCPTDEAKSPALRQICIDSYATMEALAAQYGIKFHKARNANDVVLLPHLTGRLKLAIDLDATDPAAQPSAIAARIEVLAHYTHAVNRASELSQDDAQAKHPLNVPQHVDAILWEASLIKAVSGSQDELVKPMSDAINEKLRAFFADYAKANQ